MNTAGTWQPETFTTAVGDAVWAPSIHNTQPWRFRRTSEGIDVLIDPDRALPVCDPTGRAARVSCGAAAYNLLLALAMAEVPAVWATGSDDVQVHLTPGPPRPATPVERQLYRQIYRRHTNRSPFADSPVDAGCVTRLVEAARLEDGWLDFASGEAALVTIADLVRRADAELMADPAYVAELRDWTRSADRDVEGVGRHAGGPAPHPDELLTRRDFGGRARDATRDPTRTPVVAVLGVHGEQATDDVRAGMVLQRVLLTAADLGLATAIYSQPIEVPAVREQLRLALRRMHSPQLVLRFGYAPTTCYTGRRAVVDVIEP